MSIELDGIELEDLGDAAIETRQRWFSYEYQDNIFAWGAYPG